MMMYNNNRVKNFILKQYANKSRELFINNKKLYVKTKKIEGGRRNFSTLFQPDDPDPSKWVMIALLCGSLFAIFKK
jgi:hypothetical protein